MSSMSTTASTDPVIQRLTRLEEQMRTLHAEVSRLRDGRNGDRHPGLSLDDPAVAEARRIAVELFGSAVEVAVECDPENPEYEFIAFDVECRGDVKELVNKRREWHRRVNAAAGGRSRDFRLSIYPV